MKTINKLTIILAVFLTISISSCKKAIDYNGEKSDLENFIGADVVQKMIDQGFDFNYGATPPQVEGSFKASPHNLLSSTVPGDPTTHTFSDFDFKFKNQNSTNLTIEFEATELAFFGIKYFEHKGLGTFISGKGDYFTVAVKTEVKTKLFGKAIATEIISGKMTDSGIVDYQLAGYVLEIKANDPLIPFIPEKTGRVIIDGDNVAARQ